MPEIHLSETDRVDWALKAFKTEDGIRNSGKRRYWLATEINRFGDATPDPRDHVDAVAPRKTAIQAIRPAR